MINIPLFSSDQYRRVLKTPAIALKNRFYEQNPVLSGDPGAVVARPGLRKFAQVGDGPIRKTFSSPGTFDGDLFVVSSNSLYRISSADLTETDIGDLTAELGDVSMCTTAPIEEVPAYLYIADGGVLWVYTDNGHALAHLTTSGAIANNDTVRLDEVYYKWTTGSVNAGTPLGTAANPWLVALGAGNAAALENLFNAVNASGLAGTDYTTVLTRHPLVNAIAFTITEAYFEAVTAGTAGNAYESTETGANISFGGGTFAGGGSASLRQVMMPDDVGAISVAHINSYVIVVPVQEEATQGRFYWIEPGENTVDPLNFATAERNPDGVHQVVVFGDMFWLLGENTTEPWITTGAPAAPMERFRGILFDRGSWPGTAIQVKDSLIVVDEDGGVFQISGGQKRVSNPGIEERIRRAKQTQAFEE